MGEVGFADYHRDTEPSLEGKPEAGWVSHGKGYATEAVTAMLVWADENLDCSSTAAMFDPSHLPSINVTKKAGYSNEVLWRYEDQDALFMERVRLSV